MPVPEYLMLLEDSGDVKVTVKFKDNSLSISDFSISWQNVARFLDPESGRPYSSMTFDEHPFEIERYEVNPWKNTVTIFTK